MNNFNTKYSSLTYLQQLNLNKLKINHSFIQSINIISQNNILIHSIIKLTHNLKLSIVTKNIKNPTQINQLHNYNYNTTQNYHLNQPINRKLMTNWLHHNTLLNTNTIHPHNPKTPNKLTHNITKKITQNIAQTLKITTTPIAPHLRSINSKHGTT